jgi:hypothetical protein
MRIHAHDWPAAVLALCIILLVPALAGAAPMPAKEHAVAERLDGDLLAWVRHALSVLWGENGSGADPSGEALHGDNGSGADPDGNHTTGNNGAIFGPSSRF